MANVHEKAPLPESKYRVNSSADDMYHPLARPNSGQFHPDPHEPYAQRPISQKYDHQQPQSVYIQSMPSAPRRYENYRGKLSIRFGATNIVLVTLSIALNGVGFYLQDGRNFEGKSDFAIIMCPAVFCGFFIYLAASFAIAAGIRKTKRMIKAHLILASIGSFFACVFLAFALGALDYEVPANRYDPSGADRGSIAIIFLWIIMSTAIFVMNTWGAALCCRVLGCGVPNHSEDVETSEFGGVTVPPGGVVLH